MWGCVNRIKWFWVIVGNEWFYFKCDSLKFVFSF